MAIANHLPTRTEGFALGLRIGDREGLSSEKLTSIAIGEPADSGYLDEPE